MIKLDETIRSWKAQAHLLNPLRDKTCGPIGVDLGGRCLKIMQMRRDAQDHLRVVADIEKLPPTIRDDWRSHLDELAAIIRKLLKSNGFVGSEAVACMPNDLLEYRNMRLDPAADELRDIEVQTQMADLLNTSPEDLAVQYFDAGIVWENEQKRREIIAMAAPLAAVNDYMTLLNRSGLVSVAIDATPSALARSVHSTPDDNAQLLLDVGYRSTTVLIIRNNEIRFVKRFDTGVIALDHVVARELKTSIDQVEATRENQRHRNGAGDNPADAQAPHAINDALSKAVASQAQGLAKEIAKCIQYYNVSFREGKPQTGFILGGGAQEQALVEQLSRKTGVQLQLIETLAEVDWTQTFRTMGGRLIGRADWVRSTRALAAKAPPSLWATSAGLATYFESDLDQGENP